MAISVVLMVIRRRPRDAISPDINSTACEDCHWYHFRSVNSRMKKTNHYHFVLVCGQRQPAKLFTSVFIVRHSFYDTLQIACFYQTLFRVQVYALSLNLRIQSDAVHCLKSV